MRKSGRCSKCNGDKIASFRDGLVGETPKEPKRLRRQQTRLMNKAIANDEAAASELLPQLDKVERDIARFEERHSYRRYVCGASGFSETYLSSAASLANAEVVERLELTWESPPSVGPYR